MSSQKSPDSRTPLQEILEKLSTDSVRSETLDSSNSNFLLGNTVVHSVVEVDVVLDTVWLCCLLEPIPESNPVEPVLMLNGLSESLEESNCGTS